MSNISVLFTSGDDELTAFPKSCTINKCVCSESLQHAESTCSIELVYEADLFAFLALKTDIITVVKDGQNVIFTGVVNTDLSWQDDGNPFPITSFKLTVKDNTYLFEKKAAAEIGLINTTVQAVIHRICQECGVTVFADQEEPEETVQAVIIDEGTSFKEVIANVLYQYGYSYTFNEYGELVYFKYKDIPDELEAIEDDDILTGAKFNRLDRKYTGVKVSYNSLTRKNNELVYFVGGGYNSDNTVAAIILQPGVYYPFESAPTVEADEGQVYQNFRGGYATSKTKYNGEKEYQSSEETSLLYTQNHTVVRDWENGNIVINREQFGFRRASVRLYNAHSTEDAKLYSLSIRADSWYRDTKCFSINGSADNPFACESEYIYSNSAADTLAAALAPYFCGAVYKVTFSSERYIQPGTFCSIDTGLSGFYASALAISSSYDYGKGIYTNVFITLSDVTIDITRYKNKETAANKAALQASGNALEEARSARIRALISLSASGKEGEVAYYQQQLYRYVSGTWQLISPDNYMGIYTTETPEYAEGRYFLCGADFSQCESLYTDSGLLELEDGTLLGVSRTYHKDSLYLASNNIWQELTDKNDYRYIVATNDLINTGGNVSPNLQQTIQINARAVTGRYLGIQPWDPQEPEIGDYFLFNGTESELRKKGYLYMYKSTGWIKLEVNAENFSYYMTALSDLYTQMPENTEPQFFSTVFAQALFASKAAIQELQSQRIVLTHPGIIESNFDGTVVDGRITGAGTRGFALDSTGQVVAHSIFVRGPIASSGILQGYNHFFWMRNTTEESEELRDFISFLERVTTLPGVSYEAANSFYASVSLVIITVSGRRFALNASYFGAYKQSNEYTFQIYGGQRSGNDLTPTGIDAIYKDDSLGIRRNLDYVFLHMRFSSNRLTYAKIEVRIPEDLDPHTTGSYLKETNLSSSDPINSIGITVLC